MKKDLHPNNYRPVVFQDLNNGTTYVTRSTVVTEEKITVDGVEYPLVKVHISSSSHPFFTGEERIVDIEGRVDKFKARAEAAQAAREARAKAAAKKVTRKESQDAKKEDADDDASEPTVATKTTAKKPQEAPAETPEPVEAASEE